jgi:hypothetical protein
MLLSQIDTQPYTIAVTVPADGIKLATLLDPLQLETQYIHLCPRQPVSASYHAALYFTTGRPGVAATADDWTTHAGYIGEGECWYLPFDKSSEVYIKPVVAVECSLLLIVG